MWAGWRCRQLAADGVFLSHDERYKAAAEYLRIWRDLLSGRTTVNFEGKHPPRYFGGSSPQAHALAASMSMST